MNIGRLTAFILARLPKCVALGMAAFAALATPSAHAIRTPIPDRLTAKLSVCDTSPSAISEPLVAVADPAPADAWLIEAVYPVGQAPDGDFIDIAVLVEPETHTRVWCYVKSPLGLSPEMMAEVNRRMRRFNAGVQANADYLNRKEQVRTAHRLSVLTGEEIVPIPGAYDVGNQTGVNVDTSEAYRDYLGEIGGNAIYCMNPEAATMADYVQYARAEWEGYDHSAWLARGMNLADFVLGEGGVERYIEIRGGTLWHQKHGGLAQYRASLISKRALVGLATVWGTTKAVGWFRRWRRARHAKKVLSLVDDSIPGMYGTVSRAALEKAAAGGGPTVRVVTRLSGPPQGGRKLFVAVGEGMEALAAAEGRAGRPVFRGKIPRALLMKLEDAGLAVRGRLPKGTEIKFLPQASEFIVPFLKPE